MPRLRNRLARFGLVAALVVSARSADAQAPLKWTFKKGETLKYAFSQSNDIKYTLNGQQNATKNDLDVDLTWTVVAVEADGSAEMKQVIDRARTKITAGTTVITYDSKEKAGEDPGVQALAKLYEAAVGKPYTIKITPTGQVKEVKVPEAVTAALVGSPFQAIADSGTFFTPKGVENVLAQVLPTLDAKATAKGAKWESTLKIPTGPIIMNLKTGFTMVEPGPPARISSTIDTAITVGPGVNATFDVTKQEGKGAVTFDTASGHLSESKLDQAFEITVKANGAEIAQVYKIQASFTLVP